MNKLKELINKLCPNGVKYKNIQELCKISRGKVMSKDFIKANAGEYPVYSSQTENNGELGKISTYDFDGEYLTWTTDGANAGSVFYRKGKFSVTNVCGLLEIKCKVMHPKFLYYVLSIEAPKYVNAGMGNPKLMSNVMAKIRVAVPPLEVQCEIVHILDDFTELSAELSAELKARQKQFNFYKESLISQNYEKIVRLKDICDIKGRIGFRGYKRNDLVEKGQGAISFSPGNITNETINYDKCTYISWEKYEESPEIMINNGDVILCKTGSTLGKVAQVKDLPEKATLNPQLVVLKNLKCNSTYLKYIIGSYDFQTAMQAKKGLGSVPNISQKDIGNIEVGLHSKENQGKIARILERLDNLCNSISEGLPAEIEARQKQYEYYRDKLLTFKELKVNE